MNKEPRIVLVDIETSPILGYTWGVYEQNVLKVVEPCRIISTAWKLLGEDSITCKALPDYKGYKPNSLDDERLVKEVWKVLDDADIVIAHHGDAFDVKKLNARFVSYGLSAPAVYKTIDTRKVAKRYFMFDSNKLADLGVYLGEGKKLDTGGMELWFKCMAGDAEAWKHMKEYNTQDVALLERIYLRLRPFMVDHPNLNVIANTDVAELTCPVCLGADVTKRGFSITRTGRKQRFQCNDCGSWSSGPYQKSKITLR